MGLTVWRAGTTVHGYRLERRVGSGGFCEVWAAQASGQARRVALKLLRPPVTDGARARLEREIRAHALVQHPNVRGLEGALPDGGGLVFELLSGPSLSARLESGALGFDEVAPLFAELLGALAAVHEAGIVHRDVTPANVVLDGPAHAKLIDFGIAKLVADSALDAARLTTDDAALGSLLHQAPEQIDDPRAVDGRADLYGVGSMLFMALAGRAAFRAPTAAALLVLKSMRDAPSLSEVTSRPWPHEIESLLAKLLAREPGARFASAREVADHLAAVPTGA